MTIGDIGGGGAMGSRAIPMTMAGLLSPQRPLNTLKLNNPQSFARGATAGDMDGNNNVRDSILLRA